MAPYHLVYLARSDGKLEIITKAKKKEANAPTEAQLDDSTDSNGTKDYYKALDVGDAKEVDWRRKLGGMLMREIGDKEHLGIIIRRPFPPFEKLRIEDNEVHREKLHSCSST